MLVRLYAVNLITIEYMRIQPEPRQMKSPLNALQKVYQHMVQRGDANTKAVFFDRDGTINVEEGYLIDPVDICLLPYAGLTLNRLSTSSFLTIIITNQSAIGRGLMNYSDFLAVSAELWKQLQQSDARYHGLYYCPHNPDTEACTCRKPRPGLLLQAAIDFGINLQESYFVGDKISDIEAGKNVDCKTVLCRTGFGQKTEILLSTHKYVPNYIGNDLLEIAEWIAKDCQHTA